VKTQIKKIKDELKEAQDELKELRQLDPQRLKRQVTDLKKKTLQQATDNQSVNNALVAARKELKDTTAERDKLQAELKASRNSTDFFWQSVDGIWTLYESTTVLKDETVEDVDKYKRIRCMNTDTGVSVLSKGRDDKDKAEWLGNIEIPEEVSIEAGKRLLSIAAELEEENKD
jgi:chromosome segregation ATPase